MNEGAAYTLKIEHDDMPLNPRIDYDTFGKMCCWHSRYNLGDKHDFTDPDDFLKSLVCDTISPDELVDFIKNDGCNSVKFRHDSNKNEWILMDMNEYTGEWFDGEVFTDSELENPELAMDVILEVLPTHTLKELAERENLMLPLYLYDHSGISISCNDSYPYNDRWDAGQVGWIYASYEDIRENYGDTNAAMLEKIKQQLITETSVYNDYLCGEFYGYVIEKNGDVVDSCRGFKGDLQTVIKDMQSCVNKEFQHLFDHVGYDCMEYSEDKAVNKKQEKPSVRQQLNSLKSKEKSAPKQTKARNEPEL